MAHIMVGDALRQEEEERVALTADVEGSVEDSVSQTPEPDSVSFSQRLSNFRELLCGRRNAYDRRFAAKALVAFVSLTAVLVLLVVLSTKPPSDSGKTEAVMPVLLLVSISLSAGVQCIRACSWAWHQSGRRPAEYSSRGIPRVDDPAEAHIAFALSRTLGSRVLARPGARPGSVAAHQQGQGQEDPQNHGLDPFVAQQLRSAGMDDAAVSRVALLIREGDFRPDDYNTLLALDEHLDDLETAVMIMHGGGGGGRAMGRRGIRMAGRRGRSREAEVEYNPQAANPHEIARLPTYIYQPKAVRGHSARPEREETGGTTAVQGEREASQSGVNSEQVQIAVAPAAPPATGSSESGSTAPFCNICLEHVTGGDTVRILPCLHSFHAECVDNWLNRKANCPVCKVSIRDPVWSAL